MVAQNYEDLDINQGSDVAIEIQLVNEDGSKHDLANKSVSSKLKRRYADSDADPDTVSFNSIVAIPATDGIITLSLTNSETASLQTRGRYVYDVELSFEDSDGETIVERVFEGQITVNPAVQD